MSREGMYLVEWLSKSESYSDEMHSTTLEVEPKLEAYHIDLLKLYHRVVGEGGFDLVSDTKKKPLMWRKIAEIRCVSAVSVPYQVVHQNAQCFPLSKESPKRAG